LSVIAIYHHSTAELQFPWVSMTERLPASRFPESADVYFCDKCGRDVTRHLYRGRAHVRHPIGPMRYGCACGQTYLTGATEWDYLSDWDKRQWRADVGLAFILFVLLLSPVALGYLAYQRRSIPFLAVFVASLVFAAVFLRLFGLFLLGFADIAWSIWRTRVLTKVRKLVFHNSALFS